MNGIVRRFGRWRLWWNLAAALFTVSSFAVLLGPWVSGTVPGQSPPRLLRSVVRFGFPASVALFFVGFLCLHRTQEADSE